MSGLYKPVLLFIFFIFFSFNATANGASPTTYPYNQYQPINDAQYQQVEEGPVIVEAFRNLPHFSNISVSDDLKVVITGGRRQSVVLSGDERAVEEISTRVSNQTLYIERAFLNRSKDYDHSVFIEITTNGALSGLYTTDSAILMANNIRSTGLTIRMLDNSYIKVNARDIVLREAVNGSSRDLVLSGINSRAVHLKGTGDGEIILSGIVNELTAHLFKQSCLRAEGLRIRDAYIQTEENALAMVTPSNALYAFAFDSSNIYYSRTPNKIVQDPEQSGNILKVP